MNKYLKPFTYLALFAMFFSSCQAGYQKEGGAWAWVSYDESVGKRVNYLEQVDNRSFEVLRDKRYARDKYRVFYNGMIVNGADPASFEVIHKDGYAKDKRRVFLECYPLIDADPDTFEYLEFPYSRDKAHVYCGILPLALDAGEVREFRVTNTDRLMSTTRNTTLTSYFVEIYPEYQWVDTLGFKHILVGTWGSGETSKRKFKGFREVQ